MELRIGLDALVASFHTAVAVWWHLPTSSEKERPPESPRPGGIVSMEKTKTPLPHELSGGEILQDWSCSQVPTVQPRSQGTASGNSLPAPVAQILSALPVTYRKTSPKDRWLKML